MKSISGRNTLILPALLTLVFTFFAAGQELTKTIKKVNARHAATLNGADLFRRYCAVCHGNNAKGDGPVAGALKKRPADLTQLARENNGSFPDLRVMNFIKGRDVVAARGRRDMPVWGAIFSQNEDIVQLQTYVLLKYIEQLQVQ